MSTARIIALSAAAAFLLLAILGFFALPAVGTLFGVFPMNTALKVVYLLTGLLLAYGGLSTELAHGISAVVGVVYLLLGVLGFFTPDLFGLMPIHGANIALHLLAGGLLFYDWLGTPSSTAHRPA